jgi:hypothetical protein
MPARGASPRSRESDGRRRSASTSTVGRPSCAAVSARFAAVVVRPSRRPAEVTARTRSGRLTASLRMRWYSTRYCPAAGESGAASATNRASGPVPEWAA